ncbi:MULTISPECIES: ABC transporter permease [Gordonia]|nr:MULTISPECIES: ABC transporter permease [Gordonia]
MFTDRESTSPAVRSLPGVLTRYLISRIAATAAMLLLLSVIVFIGVDLLPGDPVSVREGRLGPERAAELRSQMGLDRPVLDRYIDWLTGILKGDLGTSATGVRVADLLGHRLANTAILVGIVGIVAVPVSLALGLWLGWRRGSVADTAASAIIVGVQSIPDFIWAGLWVLIFALTLGWLPALSLVPPGESPLAQPEVLVLPVVTLGATAVVYATRVIRAAAATSYLSDHAEFLQLNGFSILSVTRLAVLPTVVPAAVQVWVVSLTTLLGGTVMVEGVFGYPGIGEALINAVSGGDLPVAQTFALLLATIAATALLVTDTAGMVVRHRTGRQR